MRVIIAGDRNFHDYEFFKDVMDNSELDISFVIAGGATGVDTMAIKWAREKYIPYKIIKADWDKHGKAAGPIRNQKMADAAEGLILFHGGGRGSESMWKIAEKMDLPREIAII